MLAEPVGIKRTLDLLEMPNVLSIMPSAISHPNPAIFQWVEGKPLTALADLVHSGVRATAFDEVARSLHLPKTELAARIGIVFRTVSRRTRRPGARLSSDATAKILRVIRTRNLARKLFATDAAVAEWLQTPDSALHGRAPLDLLDTEYGASEVENLLTGMIHGFSA